MDNMFHDELEPHEIGKDDIVKPQYICMNCKTLIGPIWDDDENQCNCDEYEYLVLRLHDEREVGKLETDLAAKDETIKKLSEALANYGVHEEDCGVWQSRYDIEDDVVECTCGLEAALTAGKVEA